MPRCSQVWMTSSGWLNDRTHQCGRLPRWSCSAWTVLRRFVVGSVFHKHLRMTDLAGRRDQGCLAGMRGSCLPEPSRRRLKFTFSGLICAVGLSCAPEGAPTDLEGNTPPPRAGQVIWFTQGRAQGVPAQNASTVFFPGAAHEVTALDKKSGAVRWTARTPETSVRTLGLGVVAGDKAIVLADRLLYAFHPTTGAPKWVFGSAGMLPAQSIPAAWGDVLISGSLEGRVYSVDMESGGLLWERSIIPSAAGTAAAFDPVIADSLVFVGVAEREPRFYGGVAALNLRTGDIVWYSAFLPRSGMYSSACNGLVSVSNGIVIATASDGQVYALEAATGRKLWIAPHDPALNENEDLRYTTIVGSVVVVGSTSGYITALDLNTGAMLWRTNAGRGSASDPLTADDRKVYIIHSGGQLTAIEASTGRIDWRYEEPNMTGTLFYAAIVDSLALYAGGRTGFLAFVR